MPKNVDELSAATITIQLRTEDDTLSVWRFAADQWEEAALAVGSGFKKLESFDVVWLDETVLSKSMVLLTENGGQTPVTDLVSKHVDIAELNYATLGAVAIHIAERICENHWRKVLKAEMRDILVKAALAGRVKMDNLKQELRAEIEPLVSTAKGCG